MEQHMRRQCMRCHGLVHVDKLWKVVHDRVWCAHCVLDYDGHIPDIVVSLPTALLRSKSMVSRSSQG